MEVICLENEAFYAFIEEVVHRLKEKDEHSGGNWHSGEKVSKNQNPDFLVRVFLLGTREATTFYQ